MFARGKITEAYKAVFKKARKLVTLPIENVLSRYSRSWNKYTLYVVIFFPYIIFTIRLRYIHAKQRKRWHSFQHRLLKQWLIIAHTYCTKTVINSINSLGIGQNQRIPLKQLSNVAQTAQAGHGQQHPLWQVSFIILNYLFMHVNRLHLVHSLINMQF